MRTGSTPHSTRPRGGHHPHAGGSAAAAIVLATSFSTVVLGVVAFAQAPSSRSRAEQTIAEVSASAAAPSVSTALDNARGALAVGAQARAAKDEPHAAIADDTALDWAETARALQVGDTLTARAEGDERQAPAASASASAGARRLDEALAKRAAFRKTLEAMDEELAARPLTPAPPRSLTMRPLPGRPTSPMLAPSMRSGMIR